MERLERSSIGVTVRTYCLLTKPGIILGNAVTAAAGFALASTTNSNLITFIAMLIGLSSIIASGCIFNNYIDRELDSKMTRTKNRPLACSLIPIKNALIFGAILGIYGIATLLFFTNILTTLIACVGLAVYVLAYSIMKYRSVHATLIGSIAGAVPPVVGYTAVHGSLDNNAIILFFMVALWQMPHFFAIAIYRIRDYAAASLPVMPIARGIRATKIAMLVYTIGFIIASAMLTLLGTAFYSYFFVTLFVGICWLILAILGFTTSNDTKWARKMFFFSLIVVIEFCFMLCI